MDERIRGGAACSLALRAAYCMRVQYRSAVKERTTPPALRASVSVRVLPPLRSERLLDQVRERVRYLHFSIRTEQAYVHWVRAFVRFHDMRHPAEMGAAEVEAFLSWLAAERRVAVSTHRQALSAIVFLYQKVFGFDLPWLAGIGRPQAPRRLPVVLSHGEVAAVLEAIESVEHRLFAELLYGTGMRLMEGLRLRVKDVEFERSAIVVREGKGRKDRVVMLPAALVPALQAQLRKARQLWQQDRADGTKAPELSVGDCDPAVQGNQTDKEGRDQEQPGHGEQAGRDRIGRRPSRGLAGAVTQVRPGGALEMVEFQRHAGAQQFARWREHADILRERDIRRG